MIPPGKHTVAATERSAGSSEYSSPACLMHELAPASAARRAVQIKRVYDDPARSDGYRVLVDRIWPRGIKKQDAALDDWLRELAPSTELRKWFGHEPKRWPEFRKRYRAELLHNKAQLNALRQRAEHRRVTLIYSARDLRFNQAVALKEVIEES
jgi:uncharacterized protein YeaO (DUF488 family)